MCTGLDGHLSPIALTLTCQRVSFMHFKIYFGVQTLNQNSVTSVIFKLIFKTKSIHKEGAGSEEARVSNL